MNKEKMNQIIDEVYENYLDGGEVKWLKQMEVNTPIGKMNIPIPYPKEEFINKCKTDSEFSERWGLKIEERELSRDERIDLYCSEYTGEIRGKYEKPFDDFIDSKLTTRNIPTKIITITYNGTKIESYG